MLHWLHLTFCQADQLQQNPPGSHERLRVPQRGRRDDVRSCVVERMASGALIPCPSRRSGKTNAQERRPGQSKTPSNICAPTDSNARAVHDVYIAASFQGQFERRSIKGKTIQLATDLERRGQFSWPGAKFSWIAPAPSPLPHDVNLPSWLQSAQKHCASWCANKVQTPVETMRAIHICDTRPAKHRLVSSGRAAEAVRCRIVSLIGFRFDYQAAAPVNKETAANQILSHNVSGL